MIPLAAAREMRDTVSNLSNSTNHQRQHERFRDTQARTEQGDCVCGSASVRQLEGRDTFHGVAFAVVREPRIATLSLNQKYNG